MPSALADAPAGWAHEMLRDGEAALLAGEGLGAVNSVAHELDVISVLLIRSEATPAGQDETVVTYAASLPLIWVAARFGAAAREWAHARGPMTLLVEAAGALSQDDRRRIDRFVAILGRQSE